MGTVAAAAAAVGVVVVAVVVVALVVVEANGHIEYDIEQHLDDTCQWLDDSAVWPLVAVAVVQRVWLAALPLFLVAHAIELVDAAIVFDVSVLVGAE